MGSLVGNVPSLNAAGFHALLRQAGAWLSKVDEVVRNAFLSESHWLHGDVCPLEDAFWEDLRPELGDVVDAALNSKGNPKDLLLSQFCNCGKLRTCVSEIEDFRLRSEICSSLTREILPSKVKIGQPALFDLLLNVWRWEEKKEEEARDLRGFEVAFASKVMGTRAGLDEATRIVRDISCEVNKGDKISRALASLSSAARFCCKALSLLVAQSANLRAGLRRAEEFWIDLTQPRQYVDMIFKGKTEALKKVQSRIWGRILPKGGMAILFYDKPSRPGRGGTLYAVSIPLFNEWVDAIATIGGSDMCGVGVYPSVPLEQVDEMKFHFLESLSKLVFVVASK